MRWIKSGQSVLTSFVETVLPPVDDTELVGQVTFLDEPCCAICGFPFSHQVVGIAKFDMVCGACTARRPAYATARSAIQYDDASRGFVLGFKHGGKTERLSIFAAQMQRVGQNALAHADALIPVPLHRQRLIKRRYNQSTLLAQALSKRCSVPVDPHILRRKKPTRTQGGLSASGRRRNVQGAFMVSEPDAIEGKRLVLIDDVFTTGATLESCARTLKRAGAARVDALCLARVVRPRGDH